MTRILLDTHVALWMMLGEELSTKTRSVIDSAAAQGDVLLSPISAWELGMLARKGKLELDEMFILDTFSQPGIVAAPITPNVAVASTMLDPQLHGDPADRILIATALQYGASFATRDATILAYAKQTRAFECIKC